MLGFIPGFFVFNTIGAGLNNYVEDAESFNFFENRSFRYENDDEKSKNETITFKNRFLKVRLSLTIVNDNPSLTIVNDDPSLTIVNDESSLTIVNDESSLTIVCDR